MTLIDADKLHYVKVLIQSNDWKTKEAVVVFAKEINHADVYEELRGNWWENERNGIPVFQCSKCLTYFKNKTNYCSTCGAKMIKGEYKFVWKDITKDEDFKTGKDIKVNEVVK